MKKKAKSTKLVTAPLTWGDSIRGKAVKRSEGGRRNTFSFWKKTFCFAKAFTKLLEKVLSKTLRENSLRRKPVLKEKRG